MSRKMLTVCSAALLAVAGLTYWTGSSIGEDKNMERVYELRTYTTYPGKLDALNKRFRDHTMRIFEKHGMRNEMYWVPTDPKLAENTLIYIISHDSPEAAKKSWEAFRNDPEWIKVRDASEVNGKLVEKVVSIYMKPTDYSPKGK